MSRKERVHMLNNIMQCLQVTAPIQTGGQIRDWCTQPGPYRPEASPARHEDCGPFGGHVLVQARLLHS